MYSIMACPHFSLRNAAHGNHLKIIPFLASISIFCSFSFYLKVRSISFKASLILVSTLSTNIWAPFPFSVCSWGARTPVGASGNRNLFLSLAILYEIDVKGGKIDKDIYKYISMIHKKQHVNHYKSPQHCCDHLDSQDATCDPLTNTS